LAQSLASRKQDTKIIQRLAELEQEIQELRSNQVAKLSFAGITLDGTGSTGNMSANGTSIITNTGLVSDTNFPVAEVTTNPSATTTSTSMVDLAGSSLSPFTTQGTTNVFISVVVGGYNANFGVDGSWVDFQVVDSVGGVVISSSLAGTSRLTSITQNGSMAITGWNMSFFDETQAIPVVIQMSAGTHTLKIQYAVSGTGTAHVNFFYLGYIILGQQT